MHMHNSTEAFYAYLMNDLPGAIKKVVEFLGKSLTSKQINKPEDRSSSSLRFLRITYLLTSQVWKCMGFSSQVSKISLEKGGAGVGGINSVRRRLRKRSSGLRKIRKLLKLNLDFKMSKYKILMLFAPLWQLFWKI